MLKQWLFGVLVILTFCCAGFSYSQNTSGWWSTYEENAKVANSMTERFSAAYSGPYFKHFPNNWEFILVTPEIRNTPEGASFNLSFSFDGSDKRCTYNASIQLRGNGSINLKDNPTEKLEELAGLIRKHNTMTVYVPSIQEHYDTVDSEHGRQVVRSGTTTAERVYTFGLKGAADAMKKAQDWAMAWRP